MKKICIVCGQPTGNCRSIEHIYPRAIFKWAQYCLPADDYSFLKKAIQSKDNRAYSHFSCNQDKQDSLPDISALFFTEKKKLAVYNLSKQLAPFCDWYENYKSEILASQNGQCYLCHKPISSGIIRRIDKTLPRTRENASIICPKCNQ